MTAGLIWSIGLSVLGILGIYLAGRKNKLGWAIGLLAQVLWIIFAVTTGQFGFIASALAYGTIYAKNWWSWHKDSSEEEKADED